jgi:hypothetical protein
VEPGPNPAHIVPVLDFSRETLEAIAEHLDVSTAFEHLVYREAELDAIWSLTAFYLGQARGASQEALRRLHEEAHRAHDLVGAGRPREAAAILRSLTG